MHTLEVNNHLKNGGSFWMMLNPMKNGEPCKPIYKWWQRKSSIYIILQIYYWLIGGLGPGGLDI